MSRFSAAERAEQADTRIPQTLGTSSGLVHRWQSGDARPHPVLPSLTWTGAVEEVHDAPAQGDSLLRRLTARKFVQWTAGYLAMAWVVLQLTDVLSEIWGFGILLPQVISLLLGLGVFPALVVAWYHGERGRQRVCGLELALVAASIMGSVFTLWAFMGFGS